MKPIIAFLELGMQPGGLVLAVIVALGVSATAAAAEDRTLPKGKLTLFAGNAVSANFIVDDTIRREGDRVSVVVLRAYVDDVPAGWGDVMYHLISKEIDCSTRTHRLRSMSVFRASGQYELSLPGEPSEPIRPQQSWDFLARVVCDGVRFGPEASVNGYKAAGEAALNRLSPGAP